MAANVRSSDGGETGMIPSAFLWAVALGVAMVAAQTPDGQVAGRISNTSGGALPGVRIAIADGDQSKEAITDSDGRFVVQVTMGTYRVAAALEGFRPASGEVRLSPSSPRAFLAWRLDVGCLGEDVRVTLGAREAAPLVDAILHIRVTSADGPVLMSVRPDCAGVVRQEYSVQVLGAAPGRSRTRPGPRRMLVSGSDALAAGQDYLALLWPDGSAADGLVLPIVSGQVASPRAGELNGMRVDEALRLLGKWSQERQR